MNNRYIFKIVTAFVVGVILFALIGVGVFCINKDYEFKQSQLPWTECNSIKVIRLDKEETYSTNINFRQEYYYDGGNRVWFRTRNTRNGNIMFWGVFNVNDIEIDPPPIIEESGESQNVGN